jgi:hypothetical protein
MNKRPFTCLFFTAALLFAALLNAANAHAAPSTAEGGSTQVAAQDGCMNQWMFNGVWRMRVTNVAFQPAGDHPNAWNVTMQWNNGTSYAGVAPMDTGKQDLVLALANGDTLTATDSTIGNLNQQQLDFHTFPQSGRFTYTQTFISRQTLDQNNKPAKLLVTFDVAKYKAAHPGASAKFWKTKTPGYNYRIDLTCTK